MESLRNFLTVSSKGEFLIKIENDKPFTAPCDIKYIFLEIGDPTIGIIFLPHYGPAINSTKHEIVFMPFIEHGIEKSIILQNDNIQSLHIFSSFASLADGLLQKCYDLTKSNDLSYSQTMSDGSFIEYSNSTLKFSNGTQTIEKNINSRSKIVLSPINSPPAFGLHYGNQNAITWFNVDSFSSLAEWVLFMYCAIANATEFESNQLANISIEISSDEQIVTNDSESEKNATSQITIERTASETASIEEEKERQMMKQKTIEIQKMKDDLSNQASHYHSQTKFLTISPEPEIPKLSLPPTDEQIEFPKPSPLPPKPDFNAQELIQIVSFSQPNVQRYLPSYEMPPSISVNTTFTLDTPDYYEHQLIQSFNNDDKPNITILIAATVLNGFDAHSSISEAYSIEKEGNHISEAMKVSSKYGFKVFSPEIRERVLKFYTLSSILSDSMLCYRVFNYCSQKELNLSIDQLQQPESLPFQFPHQPVRSCISWINEILYASKMKQLEPKWIVRGLIKCISELFESYLRNGFSPTAVLKSCAPEGVSLNAWTIVKSGTETNSWSGFWILSVSEGKVSQNFVTIVEKKNVLEKCYKDCAPIRDANIVNTIYQSLSIFEAVWIENKLELPKGEEKSTLKSFQQFFGF